MEPFAEKVWAEVTADGRRRGASVLASACEASQRPIEEILELIDTSDRTRLLAGIAMSAATRTAWQAKVRTLSRSLASGLLAIDDAQIDTEQLIIAAIADIEGPHLALLDLLVGYQPTVELGVGVIAEPHRIPSYPGFPGISREAGTWYVGQRSWTTKHIGAARSPLRRVMSSLLGTLQRHGLAMQNDNTAEAVQKFAKELEHETARRLPQPNRNNAGRSSVPSVHPANIKSMTPAPSWSPTELGEQVLDRFREAGAEVPDGWIVSSTD
jgi:hypothetical protein